MTKPRTKATSQADNTNGAGTQRQAAVEASATPQPAPRRRATAATPGKRPPTVRQAAGVTVTDDDIRVRAYQLYLERNGIPEDPAGDWLRAERELTGELKPAGRRKPSPAGKRGAQGQAARE